MPDKKLVSAFIILNLFTITYMNLPEAVTTRGRELLDKVPAPVAMICRWLGKLDAAYAYVTSQDNVWRLFDVMDHGEVYIVAKAEYADGAVVTLPLPMQSERTFWQRHLFDFKETKLSLYVGQLPDQRRAYSDYLCRQFPEHDGSPVTAIVWEARAQAILPPAEAASRGTHLDPKVLTEVKARVPCGRAAPAN